MKPFKCTSCGSSHVEIKTNNMALCSHCGSHFVIKSETGKAKPSATQWTTVIGLSALMIVTMVALRVLQDDSPGNTAEQQPVTQSTQSNSGSQETPTVHQTRTLMQTESADPQAKPAPEISILNVTQGQTLIGGLFWIFHVRNDSDVETGKIKAVVSVFDENKQRIKEQSGWSLLSHLKNGEEAEIMVLISDPPEKYESIEFNAFAKAASRYDGRQLKFEVDNFRILPARNGYEIIGDVSNPFGFKLSYVKVVAIGFDQQNKPIGLAHDFATQTQLNAGQSSGFKVDAGTFLTQRPESWKIYAIAQVLSH